MNCTHKLVFAMPSNIYDIGHSGSNASNTAMATIMVEKADITAVAITTLGLNGHGNNDSYKISLVNIVNWINS